MEATTERKCVGKEGRIAEKVKGRTKLVSEKSGVGKKSKIGGRPPHSDRAEAGAREKYAQTIFGTFR